MRRWSLRRQLFALGSLASVVPLFVLVTVVYATNTSEEIGFDGEGQVAVVSSTTEFPTAVVLTALGLGAAAMALVWRWSGRAVAPMNAITRLAGDIQQGSLDRRIGLVDQAAETQALGDSFDAMLDRLERASTTQRRLVEDVSHELRTPLSALAANNEVILNDDAATIDDYRASAERNEALIARLHTTIGDLLTNARTRGELARQVDNDLMAIVARVVDQHRILRPGQPIEVSGPPTLRLGIDGPSVQRALVNLVENAARYSPRVEPIRIEVTAAPATVAVTDLGPGIPPTAHARIFDRYYGDESSDGPGIGLALVKQVADAHGSIQVTSPLPGLDRGTCFTITFTPVSRNPANRADGRSGATGEFET
ncbi:MAG: HAMP domain-containing histidine kinase [Acidimicrobiales bacterium]|nr:HAMP domain-containing histidine kinase [Acidimicrobiales bacterium]